MKSTRLQQAGGICDTKFAPQQSGTEKRLDRPDGAVLFSDLARHRRGDAKILERPTDCQIVESHRDLMLPFCYLMHGTGARARLLQIECRLPLFESR